MKRIIKHITSYLLVVLLLTISTGVSLNQMKCLVSGKTKISLSEFDACGTTEPSCSVQEKCCDYNSVVFNFDFDSTTEFQLDSKFITYIGSFTEIVSFEVFPSQEETLAFSDLPPPHGIELLKMIQVFRI